jgi:hypothetical protein
MIDLTIPTSEAVQETKLKHGIVTIFVAGSTAADSRHSRLMCYTVRHYVHCLQKT